MAMMYNFASDWSFDQFMEDAKAYNATPCKGVHCASNASYREYFMVSFKNFARDFKEKWSETHGNLYDRYEGWIGDAFAREFDDWCFSDFYKEAYNQRPHLPRWFYVQAVGFPHSEDTARTFCASPVEEAMSIAKRTREEDWA